MCLPFPIDEDDLVTGIRHTASAGERYLKMSVAYCTYTAGKSTPKDQALQVLIYASFQICWEWIILFVLLHDLL